MPRGFVDEIIITTYGNDKYSVVHRPDLAKRDRHTDEWYVDDDGDGFVDWGPYRTAQDAITAVFNTMTGFIEPRDREVA